MLNHQYIQYLLQKQQQQALTPEEEQLLDQWYRSLEAMPGSDLPAGARDEIKRQSWEALQQQLLPQPAGRRRRLPRYSWLAVAVLAALLLGVVFLMKKRPAGPATRQPAWVTLECPLGKRLKLNMPDGSVVWLNSGSQLQYDSDFVRNRQFVLHNGEVFFEVAKDAAHPFTVKTPRLSIRVLGTAFNVAAYGRLARERITVSQGSVQVRDTARCNVTLQPSQQLEYDGRSAQFTTQAVNAGQTNSWRSGDIYLTNISLEELAVRLGHIYGYEFVFDNNQLKQCLNSLHFNEKEPVTRVLELLRLINKIDYEIHGRQIRLKGRGC